MGRATPVNRRWVRAPTTYAAVGEVSQRDRLHYAGISPAMSPSKSRIGTVD